MTFAPTLSGYTLVRATPAQDLIAMQREWVEWGQPLLSQEQFVTRERHVLGTTDFSVTRRQRWVLVPADDTTTEDFLAGCETYRRPVLVKRPGKDQVERGLAYSVCSVFVPESKRRNGYAGKMMKLLQMNLNAKGEVPKRLDELVGDKVDGSGALTVKLDEGEQGEFKDGGKYGGNAICSFLYSDIDDYYSQFGWQVVGNRHVEWRPLSAQEQTAVLPQGAKWLTADQLAELGRLDRQYLLSRLEEKTPSKAIKFCIDDPEATSWRWLIKRSNFYADTLLPESAPKPKHFGLMLPSQKSYAVWMFDYIDRKVAVLRFQFEDVTAFEQLVKVVRQQAAEFGMGKCIAWNVDLEGLGVRLNGEDEAKLERGERVERYEQVLGGSALVERRGKGASLPALAWYGDKEQGDKVEWVCNEYGWWC